MLTNVSVAYAQENTEFIADRIFPTVPVEKDAGEFLFFPRGVFMRDDVKPRALGGPLELTSWTAETKTYRVVEEGVADTIDDRQYANSPAAFPLEASTVRNLTQQILIHRDRKWAAAYFQPDVWATDLTGSATGSGAGEFMWLDQANSDVIRSIDQLRDDMTLATGRNFNVAVMGVNVYRVLRNDPELIERIKYSQPGFTSDALIAQALGVERLLVARSVWNARPENIEGDIDMQWIVNPNGMLLVHAPAQNMAGINTPSGGYNFVWTGLIPGLSRAWGGTVERGRLEFNYSNWFGTRTAYGMEVVAPDLGVFIENAIEPAGS